jgi:hypothetical protein
MDVLAVKVLNEVIPKAPGPRVPRKNPVDYWPTPVLLERAAYLRKMAALGDGSASETLKEFSHHFTMLCFRSRDSIVELDENFTCLLYVLDGRATLVTGRMVVGAEELNSREIHDVSIADDTRQEIRAGDVVNIPPGLARQMLVSGERTVTYFVIKIQEAP